MSQSAGLHHQAGYDLMGAVFDVYNELGQGFLEEVYHEGLALELARRSLPFASKPMLPIFYKGTQMTKHYQADLIVCDEIVVELKASRALTSEHEAQLINYLKATRKRVGYLINFGSFPKLEWSALFSELVPH